MIIRPQKTKNKNLYIHFVFLFVIGVIVGAIFSIIFSEPKSLIDIIPYVFVSELTMLGLGLFSVLIRDQYVLELKEGKIIYKTAFTSKEVELNNIKKISLEPIYAGGVTQFQILIEQKENSDNILGGIKIEPKLFELSQLREFFSEVKQKHPTIIFDDYIEDISTGKNERNAFYKRYFTSPFGLLRLFTLIIFLFLGIQIILKLIGK